MPLWEDLLNLTSFNRSAESEIEQQWQVAYLGGGQYSIISYTTGLSITVKNGSLVLDIPLSGLGLTTNVQAAKNRQKQRLYHQVIALDGGHSKLEISLIPKITSTFFPHRRTVNSPNTLTILFPLIIIFLLRPYKIDISNLSIRNVESPNLVIDL